jgi:hypothetical protein
MAGIRERRIKFIRTEKSKQAQAAEKRFQAEKRRLDRELERAAPKNRSEIELEYFRLYDRPSKP